MNRPFGDYCFCCVTVVLLLCYCCCCAVVVIDEWVARGSRNKNEYELNCARARFLYELRTSATLVICTPLCPEISVTNSSRDQEMRGVGAVVGARKAKQKREQRERRQREAQQQEQQRYAQEQQERQSASAAKWSCPACTYLNDGVRFLSALHVFHLHFKNR